MTSGLQLDPRFKSDEVVNAVNKHFITLKDEEMAEYNVHLKTVLEEFIKHMRKDPLFNACYRKIAYVGSYYEGLKVGKPEEFDLNVVINFPIDYSQLTTVIASERHGYIKLKADPDVLPKLRKHVRWSEYNGCATRYPDLRTDLPRRYYSQRNLQNNNQVQSSCHRIAYQNYNSSNTNRTVYRRKRRFRKRIMDGWFNKDNYLDQNKFRQWFESVVNRALLSFECVNGKYVLQLANGKKYLLGHKKSGPAWTMKIDVPMGHTVDVDLVPVLEFSTPPPKPFINHRPTRQNWFAISKPLTGPSNNILWRPSFYEREQEILKGSIKQVIRLMKKLRDTQNFKSIASYYIKTLCLWELEQRNTEIQRLPPTFLFFHMLQKLRDAVTLGKIYDFWNPKNNLLVNIGPLEMSNIRDRLNNIIKEIEKRIATDPYVIAEFILTQNELVILKQAMLLGKISSLSLSPASAVQQPAERNGYLSSILNIFWLSNATPALQ